MIASANPVPWANALKPQYNEMPNKIGYIDEQAKGIRLDIDFLPRALSENQVREIMTRYQSILEVDSRIKAPLTKSYWRYKVGSDFNTFTLCLRNEELQQFDKTSPDFLSMLQNIVSRINPW